MTEPVRKWLAAPLTISTRRAVVTLFALAFILAGMSYLAAASAVHRATAATATTIQLCQAGNVARAQQVILWTHIIEISQPPPHETRAHRARRLRTVRQFVTYIHRVFAPRDCRRLT